MQRRPSSRLGRPYCTRGPSQAWLEPTRGLVNGTSSGGYQRPPSAAVWFGRALWAPSVREATKQEILRDFQREAQALRQVAVQTPAAEQEAVSRDQRNTLRPSYLPEPISRCC